MSQATPPLQAAPIYRSLGVRRIVNAADTYTALGGGRLHPEVVAAMSAATDHHVDVSELLDAVGRQIARLCGVPAALPVNGAAAGLTIAAAACLAGQDPASVGLLPTVRGERSEIVVLRCQRNSYDRALVAAGASLVEVGHADSTPEWSVSSALGPRTAALVYYTGDQFERFAPTLEDVSRLARAAGVPLIVDAAAQIPPVANLRDYLLAGADLVLFSGGKGLRGPQSSGLIVGSEQLVQACAANSYPHHSVGRSMKTSKENVLGLLAAIERAVNLDWEGQYSRWSTLLAEYAEALDVVTDLRTWVVPTGRLGQTCPRLFLDWSGGDSQVTAGEVEARLAALDPAVAIGLDRASAQQVFCNPYSVLPEEEQYLIDAIRTTMTAVLS